MRLFHNRGCKLSLHITVEIVGEEATEGIKSQLDFFRDLTNAYGERWMPLCSHKSNKG